ncbi:hypothetical protein [Nocardia xishanensis]
MANTLEHEFLTDLFRQNPDLAAIVLRRYLNVQIPEYSLAVVASEDATNVVRDPQVKRAFLDMRPKTTATSYSMCVAAESVRLDVAAAGCCLPEAVDRPRAWPERKRSTHEGRCRTKSVE